MADLGTIGSSGSTGEGGSATPAGGLSTILSTILGTVLIDGTSYPLTITVDVGLTAPSYMRILAEGFGKERESGVSRTPAEDGMVKQLKRKSRVFVTRSVILEFVTYDDYLNFIAWYRDTLDHGAHWFNLTDPEDSQVKLARFPDKLGREQPIFGTTRWRVNANIETWDK
jgi:hypothetical protein